MCKGECIRSLKKMSEDSLPRELVEQINRFVENNENGEVALDKLAEIIEKVEDAEDKVSMLLSVSCNIIKPGSGNNVSAMQQLWTRGLRDMSKQNIATLFARIICIQSATFYNTHRMHMLEYLKIYLDDRNTPHILVCSLAEYLVDAISATTGINTFAAIKLLFKITMRISCHPTPELLEVDTCSLIDILTDGERFRSKLPQDTINKGDIYLGLLKVTAVLKKYDRTCGVGPAETSVCAFEETIELAMNTIMDYAEDFKLDLDEILVALADITNLPFVHAMRDLDGRTTQVSQFNCMPAFYSKLFFLFSKSATHLCKFMRFAIRYPKALRIMPFPYPTTHAVLSKLLSSFIINTTCAADISDIVDAILREFQDDTASSAWSWSNAMVCMLNTTDQSAIEAFMRIVSVMFGKYEYNNTIDNFKEFITSNSTKGIDVLSYMERELYPKYLNDSIEVLMGIVS